MKPKRIQLKRSKGWRLPKNTIVCARPNKFGNPVRRYCGAKVDNKALVGAFQMLLKHTAWRGYFCTNEKRKTWISVRTVRKELRGKNLACWCRPGEACHADILLNVANARTHRQLEDALGLERDSLIHYNMKL